MIIYKEENRELNITTLSTLQPLTPENIAYLISLGFQVKQHNEGNQQRFFKSARRIKNR